MSQLDSALLPAFLAGIPVRVLLAPAMLVVIFLIHFFYYRRSLAVDGQQVIEIEDLTNIAGHPTDHSMVNAQNVEFCAIEGRAVACLLPLATPTAVPRSGLQPNLRFPLSVTIKNKDVARTVICAEDLTVDGASRFRSAVKVGGDLVVRGEAKFDEAVIVNGVLKVEGKAQFSGGLIAKGDALVTGDITIGSGDSQGWAVLRHLTLETRLRLNGQLISEQNLVLPEAA